MSGSFLLHLREAYLENFAHFFPPFPEPDREKMVDAYLKRSVLLVTPDLGGTLAVFPFRDGFYTGKWCNLKGDFSTFVTMTAMLGGLVEGAVYTSSVREGFFEERWVVKRVVARVVARLYRAREDDEVRFFCVRGRGVTATSTITHFSVHLERDFSLSALKKVLRPLRKYVLLSSVSRDAVDVAEAFLPRGWEPVAEYEEVYAELRGEALARVAGSFPSRYYLLVEGELLPCGELVVRCSGNRLIFETEGVEFSLDAERFLLAGAPRLGAGRVECAGELLPLARVAVKSGSACQPHHLRNSPDVGKR